MATCPVTLADGRISHLYLPIHRAEDLLHDAFKLLGANNVASEIRSDGRAGGEQCIVAKVLRGHLHFAASRTSPHRRLRLCAQIFRRRCPQIFRGPRSDRQKDTQREERKEREEREEREDFHRMRSAQTGVRLGVTLSKAFSRVKFAEIVSAITMTRAVNGTLPYD